MGEAEGDSISARAVRLNQLFLEKSSTSGTFGCQYLLSRESLLDALFVLYEECHQDSLKKDKNVAIFIEKFRNVVSGLRKLRVNVADFEVKKVIGRGHFGDVQVVREKHSGNVYAMKVLRKSETLSQQNVAFYDEERDIMAKANSAWITRLQYAFQDGTSLYLVMEYHPGGDLLGLLDRYDNIFTEDMARFYLVEIVLAIYSLHCMGYVHRDIKPDNVLIDRTGHVKLADFGSAAKLSRYDTVSSKMPVGTPDYIAPEVLSSVEVKKGSYGRSCDWWSLGIVGYEMMYGCTPFSEDKVLNTYNNILNYKKTLKLPDDAAVSDRAKDMFRNLLTEPVRRLGYEQLRKHPFFVSVNWEAIRDTVPPFVPTVNGQDDTSNFEEFEVVTPKAEIPSVARHTGFCGKNLPFVGFTYTHALDGSTDWCESSSSPSSSRKSISNLQSQFQSKKREVGELQVRLECLEKRENKGCAELAKLTLKLQEQEKVKLLAERECERLCKDLCAKRAETSSLKSLLELERSERVKTEKKALQLLHDIQEKWKKAEKRNLEELSKENESLKHFVRELEAKYREAKMSSLTLKDELSSAVKMSENAKVKAQHYKEKLRRSSAGDALQMGVLRQQLTLAEENLAEAVQEQRMAEDRLADAGGTAGQLELQVQRLEDAMQQAGAAHAESEGHLRHELKEVKDELELANRQLEQMNAELADHMEHLGQLRSRLRDVQGDRQDAVQEQLQGEVDWVGSDAVRPTNRQSFRHTKLVSKLQEVEAELRRVAAENERLQDELLTAKDSDSEKTQTVDELRAVVDRLEEGLKRLDAAKENPDGSSTLVAEADDDDERDAGERAQVHVFYETRISKLEAQLDSARAALLQEKHDVRELRTRLFKAERELKDVKIDLRIAEREVKAASEQLSAMQEKESQVEEGQRKCVAEIASQKKEIATLAADRDRATKNLERKEMDWESERARLTERVTGLQSTCEEMRGVQAKVGQAEGRSQQAEKHIKNLEQQLRSGSEDVQRARQQEDKLHSEVKKLKSERDVLQMNLDCLKQACTAMDDQLRDYESLVEVHESEEARLKEELHAVQKSMGLLREEVRRAGEAAVAEQVKAEAAEKQSDELWRKLEMVDVVRDTELQSILGQRNEYRALVAELTQQVAGLESDLHSDETELLGTRQRASLLAEENVRVKEEAAQLITQIHSLRDTNFTLSRGLEEAIEKCTTYKEKVSELENALEGAHVCHRVDKVKFEETIAQQTKLITFLQAQTETLQKKRKKTLTEKLFGRSAGGSADHPSPTSPSLGHKTPKPCAVFACHQDGERELLPSPQSKEVLNTLTKSPGLQESPDGPACEKGVPKPSSERMRHSIPHRFQIGMSMHPTKCAGCLDSIHFGRNVARCQECHISAHPKCASLMPDACSLPLGLMQHFRHSMRYKKGSRTRASVAPRDADCNSGNRHHLEGWLKVPRTGAQGWERRFARLNGTTLFLYDEDSVCPNAVPTDSVELCLPDGTAKVVEAILPSEMTTTAKSDLPYIFKLVIQPSTTCWPSRCICFMADSFQEKLNWVATLERSIKSNSSLSVIEEEESLGAVLWSIENAANVDLNCVTYLSEDCLLVGAEDGLYVIDLLADRRSQLKLRITTFGSVSQLHVSESLGILLLIAGNNRQLHWMQLSDVHSLVSGDVEFVAVQLGMLHLVDNATSCHLFVTSKDAATGMYLCMATASRVVILKWNARMQTFCVRKELSSAEPCSCALFTKNSVIVGTDKFYEVDLQNFAVEEFLDDSDPSLAHAVHGAPQLQSFPIAIFQVSPDGVEEEYLLCFYEFGIFVNEFGQRSRKEDARWSRVPLTYAFRWPYLYIVHFNSIEVCEVIVHKEKCFSVQTFVDVASPRYLGPSMESGTIILAVIHEGQADVVCFLGEVAARKKALKSGQAHVHEGNDNEVEESMCESEFSFSSSVMEALLQGDTQHESEV